MSPVIPMSALLVAARLWAVLRAQAIWNEVVGPAWIALSAGLAVMLTPAVAPGLDTSLVRPELSASLVFALGAELALGTVLGWLASLPGFALLGAAGAMSTTLKVPASGWRALLVAIAAALGLLLGVHHIALTALVGTFEIFPVGDPSSWGPLEIEPLVVLLDGLLVLALSLATPVLLVAAVAELGVALATPAFSWVTVPMTSLVRTAGVLIALGAAWSARPEAWAQTIAAPW